MVILTARPIILGTLILKQRALTEMTYDPKSPTNMRHLPMAISRVATRSLTPCLREEVVPKKARRPQSQCQLPRRCQRRDLI